MTKDQAVYMLQDAVERAVIEGLKEKEVIAEVVATLDMSLIIHDILVERGEREG